MKGRIKIAIEEIRAQELEIREGVITSTGCY